jgi:hypothetical protein
MYPYSPSETPQLFIISDTLYINTIMGKLVVEEAITEINLLQAELKKPPAVKQGASS